MKYSAKGIQLILEPNVIKHIHKFIQDGTREPESGGQLFGVIDGQKVTVRAVTGPYKNDKKGRNYYQSCSVLAQESIDCKQNIGLNYLGEWHTHPEENPQVSGLDIMAIDNIFANSKLRTDGLLLVIAGNNPQNFIINVWLKKINEFTYLNYDDQIN